MTRSAVRRTVSSPGKALTSAAVVGVLALAGCGSSSHSSTTTTPTSPPNARTLLTKALQELSSGQTALAQSDFDQVVRLDPQNKYGYYNLGYIAQTGGQGSVAEAQYRHALAI